MKKFVTDSGIAFKVYEGQGVLLDDEVEMYDSIYVDWKDWLEILDYWRSSRTVSGSETALKKELQNLLEHD